MPRPAVGEAGPKAFTGWRGGLGIRLDSMGRTPREKAEGGGAEGLCSRCGSWLGAKANTGLCSLGWEEGDQRSEFFSLLLSRPGAAASEAGQTQKELSAENWKGACGSPSRGHESQHRRGLAELTWGMGSTCAHRPFQARPYLRALLTPMGASAPGCGLCWT